MTLCTIIKKMFVFIIMIVIQLEQACALDIVTALTKSLDAAKTPLTTTLLNAPNTDLLNGTLTYPRTYMTFMQMAKTDKYPAQEHKVTTKDGYVLTMHRVPPVLTCSTTKSVVLFVHGLFLSSDDGILAGPGTAIVYLLADACYDVWCINVRGNCYSLEHVSLNPKLDPQFWNFSIDEMGKYDMPATIDYVTQQTGVAQISIVGHSQGVAIALMCAMDPTYNEKMKVGVGLSPVADLRHSTMVLVELQKLVSPLQNIFDRYAIYFEIFARGGLAQSLGRLLCGQTPLTYPFCSELFSYFLGNPNHIAKTIFGALFGYFPSGTSFKNFARWGQMAEYGFCKYYNGSGEASPIDLSNVTMKWVLVSSAADVVADPRDVASLSSTLPNAQVCSPSVALPHLDPIYSDSIPTIVMPIIRAAIEGTYVCP